MEFEPVIGLEIHAQLLTNTKIFCKCSAKFGSEQNTNVCPVCLGMPGVLPVLNKRVVEFAIKIGIATNCEITGHSIFARKNYFYPDLPKGYQISQFEEPICQHGYITIDVDGEIKKIGITRIHMEEDAGKSVHSEEWVNKNETLVDVNRCGVPLVEIVSEPDIRSPKQAALYMTKLRQIVQYLEICDGNMEEGSLRCDANISIRPKGEQKLGVKTELKNMNSIRGVERALEFEINRQISIAENGGTIEQQTLLWNENQNIATPMRSKEMAHDYRYFPDPDLVPVHVDKEWIENINQQLPELPEKRKKRIIEQYNLPEYDAEILTENKAVVDYFEAVASKTKDAKQASNWIMGEVLRTLNEQKLNITQFSIPPENLAELINLISENVVSGKIAKTVFSEMLTSKLTAKEIIEKKGLVQVSDTDELSKIVDTILEKNPNEVEKYLSGKTNLIGFFVGQIMRETKGKANPKVVNQLLNEKLNELRS